MKKNCWCISEQVKIQWVLYLIYLSRTLKPHNFNYTIKYPTETAISNVKSTPLFCRSTRSLLIHYLSKWGSKEKNSKWQHWHIGAPPTKRTYIILSPYLAFRAWIRFLPKNQFRAKNTAAAKLSMPPKVYYSRAAGMLKILVGTQFLKLFNSVISWKLTSCKYIFPMIDQ